MATSLVSRRWRHLWEHLQVLDFCDNSHCFNDQLQLFRKFAVFVNAVLEHRRSRDIRKMHLECGFSYEDTFYADSITTWIHVAIGPRLEEMSLSLSCVDDSDKLVVPSALFTCLNLVYLRLSGDIHMNVEHFSAIRLPSLKMLQLEINYAVDVDSVNNLPSGCSILETLNLYVYSHSVAKVRVPPSLKRLEFHVEHPAQIYLDIHAPDLNYLRIIETRLGAIDNLQNVVEAYLNVFSPGESVNSLVNLLRALSGIKHLELCHSTTELLLSAPVLDFPEFRYLLHLELYLPHFNSDLLVNILQKCHMLQVLIIQSDKLKRSSLAWQPSSVPNCLVSHLTSIHFKGYPGIEDEMAFAEYILQKGLVLEKMIITGILLDLRWKYNILKRLSNIPRGSAMCQLQFD